MDTDGGPWLCRAVVVATGTEGESRVPALARELGGDLQQITALGYREPGQGRARRGAGGGRLGIGVQIADELRRAGRPVTLAVGDHVRVPRTYRGHDIYFWMDELGVLDERYDEVEDLGRARRLPSLQLVGSPQRRSPRPGQPVDVQASDLTGRLVGIARGRGLFSGSLANFLTAGDLKQTRLLDRVDAYVDERGWGDRVGPIDRPGPTPLPAAVTELDLARFSAVVWATGHQPRYPWLDPALLDRRGAIRHDGGIMEVPRPSTCSGLPFAPPSPFQPARGGRTGRRSAVRAPGRTPRSPAKRQGRPERRERST